MPNAIAPKAPCVLVCESPQAIVVPGLVWSAPDCGRISHPPSRRTRSMMGAAVAMFALNFYSPLVADQLRTHRKTATIRLGDKSGKYKKGMIVTVLVGVRYGQREKVFDAVIDKVEVKELRELSPREIEHDNPEIRRTEELASFLGQLYNREVTEADQVTLIRFSEILSVPKADAFGRQSQN